LDDQPNKVAVGVHQHWDEKVTLKFKKQILSVTLNLKNQFLNIFIKLQTTTS